MTNSASEQDDINACHYFLLIMLWLKTHAAQDIFTYTTVMFRRLQNARTSNATKENVMATAGTDVK